MLAPGLWQSQSVSQQTKTFPYLSKDYTFCSVILGAQSMNPKNSDDSMTFRPGPSSGNFTNPLVYELIRSNKPQMYIVFSAN